MSVSKSHKMSSQNQKKNVSNNILFLLLLYLGYNDTVPNTKVTRAAVVRILKQIDALKTLNTNYYNYLVTPRVLALTLAMPIFVTLVDFIGVMGGYLVSVYKLGFNENLYLVNTINFLSLNLFTLKVLWTCMQ